MSKMKYGVFIILSLVTIALLSYLYLALSMRMIADDYCIAVKLEEIGLFQTFQWYYMNWSGQFTYPFIKSLTYYSLGFSAHPIMPIVIYVLWWVGNIYLLRMVFRKLEWHSAQLLAVIFGTLHIFILLSTMASRQTMYWLDALLFHVLPLALFVWIVIAWFMAIQSQNQRNLKIVIFAVIMFIYGGMQMLTTLFGLSFWFLAGILVWRFSPLSENKTALPVTVAAFSGTVIAFFVVLIAPGNFQRLEVYESLNANIGFVEALRVALRSAVSHWFLPFSLVHFIITVVSGMAICTIWQTWDYIPEDNPIILTLRRHTWILIGGAVLLGVLYTWASLFLPAMSSGRTPTRVFVTAGLTKTWVSLWIGFILGLRYTKTSFFDTTKFLILILAFGLLIAITTYRIAGNVQLIPDYQAWTKEWDVRHTALLQAHEDGAVTIEVMPYKNSLPKFLGPNPDAIWTTFTRVCMEDFYGIPNIEINESLDSSDPVRIIELE